MRCPAAHSQLWWRTALVFSCVPSQLCWRTALVSSHHCIMNLTDILHLKIACSCQKGRMTKASLLENLRRVGTFSASHVHLYKHWQCSNKQKLRKTRHPQ